MKTRLSEFEQLLVDYQRDNKLIWKQAVGWLTPKEHLMRRLPTKSEMAEAEDQPKIKKAQKIMKAVSDFAQKPKKQKKPKEK